MRDGERREEWSVGHGLPTRRRGTTAPLETTFFESPPPYVLDGTTTARDVMRYRRSTSWSRTRPRTGARRATTTTRRRRRRSSCTTRRRWVVWRRGDMITTTGVGRGFRTCVETRAPTQRSASFAHWTPPQQRVRARRLLLARLSCLYDDDEPPQNVAECVRARVDWISFRSIALAFHSVLFHSIPFYSIPFHSIPFHSALGSTG